MTMFSTESSRQFYGCFGYKSYDQTYIGSDLAICREPFMAEDKSLNGVSHSTQEEKDEGWLQLSIGGGQLGITRNEVSSENQRRDGPGLVELELLPSSSRSSSRAEGRTCGPIHEFPTTGTGFRPLSFLADTRNNSTTHFQQRQEIHNWTFRPIVPINTTTAYLSSSSFPYPSTSVASGSYYSRPPFQIYAGMDLRPETVLPRPSLDFRVIPTPRRPHSGIWFMLQASKNQERELSLPQISKSYLRIKDDRMTIRLVMKYLVNKLSLENESEIEITCKGQSLQPFLTLQHVRDNIWISSLNRNTYVTLLPNSSTIDHIMVLQYARSSASN